MSGLISRTRDSIHRSNETVRKVASQVVRTFRDVWLVLSSFVTRFQLTAQRVRHRVLLTAHFLQRLWRRVSRPFREIDRYGRWWTFLILGFVIGAVSWSGHLWRIPLLFTLPLALALPSTSKRSRSFSLMLGYFAGAMWPMVPGAALFFGIKDFPTEALLLWALYAVLQTIPYALAHWRPKRLALGFAFASLITIFSPIAILNPLTTAGVCFPGWGLVGVVATLFLFATLPAYPKMSLGLLGIASALAFLLWRPINPPAQWTASDTLYGGTSFAMAGTPEYLKAAAIRDGMLTAPDTLRLYPESTLIHWNSATNAFFTPLAQKLQAHNQTVILGADITHPGGLGYDNALIIFGADRGVYLQHLPMPYSMWNPYDPNSVPLRLGGPYTIRLHQLKAAPVICYEQLHPYPFLRASLDHPDIILGVANDYWAKKTYIRNVQHSALEAWSRLFNLPYLSATNQ